MAGFRFGRIVIAESLSDRELRSGRELFGYLGPLIEDADAPIALEFHECSGAESFRDLVRRLAEECTAGAPTPVLHVETHGSDYQNGLVFQDDSMLTWAQLADLTRQLNAATKFNLLVVVAACFGAHMLLTQFRLREPAPFWGIVAPSNLTHGSELLGSFRSFYRTLILDLNASLAFNGVRTYRLDDGGFFARSAEELFSMGMNKFLNEHCSPAAIERRVKANYKLLKKMGASRSLKVVRRGLILAHSSGYEKFVEQYFMVKEFPENLSRFEGTISKIRSQFVKALKQL
mgnify:CR=1 FL=1